MPDACAEALRGGRELLGAGAELHMEGHALRELDDEPFVARRNGVAK